MPDTQESLQAAFRVVCLPLTLVPNHCLCPSFVTYGETLLLVTTTERSHPNCDQNFPQNIPEADAWRALVFTNCKIRSSVSDLPNKEKILTTLAILKTVLEILEKYLVRDTGYFLGWWPNITAQWPSSKSRRT